VGALSAEWISFVPEADRWIVSVSIAFILSYVASALARKVGVSEMIGEITAGIILGLPVVKAGLLDDKSISVIGSLGEIGALLLLALAGLEIELDKIRRATREGVAIATLSFILPFALGYLYAVHVGYDWKAAFIVGIVLGVTAEEITTKVYMELGVLNTRIGAVTLLAAVADDVMEVIALAMALALIEAGTLSGEALRMPVYAVAYLVLGLVVSKLLARLLPRVSIKGYEGLWFYAAVLLFYSALGAVFELGPVIGAILGGFFLQYSITHSAKGAGEEHQRVVEAIEAIVLGFLVPFFFLVVGLDFNVEYLLHNPVEIAVLTLIAFLGKIGGTVAAKPFTTLSLRQLWFIGWAMNARGTLGMILTLIALRYGLIDDKLYTAIIAMAMITTVTFPFVVREEYRRNPSIVE